MLTTRAGAAHGGPFDVDISDNDLRWCWFGENGYRDRAGMHATTPLVRRHTLPAMAARFVPEQERGITVDLEDE